MKTNIFLTSLLLLLFNVVTAQKAKVTNTKITKTFVVSEETKKDLPQGVEFVNNNIQCKRGYKFVQLPNNGGVKVVEEKNKRKSISGVFVCNCSTGNFSCSLVISYGGLVCTGSTCCSMVVTINTLTMSNMQQ